jgi:hypothetical protein
MGNAIADEGAEREETPAVMLMKIAVILRDDLEPWQRLNVAAFTVSGVASQDGAVGQTYRDGSGNSYLPMFRDPVLVFGATEEEMGRTVERARSRGIAFSIFTEELFETFNDSDNRAAIAHVAADELKIAGIAFRGERRAADKVLKGLRLLK